MEVTVVLLSPRTPKSFSEGPHYAGIHRATHEFVMQGQYFALWHTRNYFTVKGKARRSDEIGGSNEVQVFV